MVENREKHVVLVIRQVVVSDMDRKVDREQVQQKLANVAADTDESFNVEKHCVEDTIQVVEGLFVTV